MTNNLKMVLTLASSGLLGCVAHGPTNGDVDPELLCRDRLVTVNHGPAFLSAHPEYIEACAGQKIIIQIVPAVSAGSARTMAAGRNPEDASWLGSRNREPDKLVIEIPEDAAYATYKYSITIDGVGTLDPRVRVARR